MSTSLELKFQWHPTLFVAVGSLAEAILCDCAQQIREHWSNVPEPLSEQPLFSDDAVPPFFGFIAFSGDGRSAVAESRTLNSEPRVQVITDQVKSGNLAWQYIRPELQRIASVNVNARYHRYKGYENEFHHVDLIMVAALDEVAETSILFDPALAVAEQFTVNRRIGIFLLNQFENRPLKRLKQQREIIGRMVEEIEKQAQNSPCPFTSCILLDESDTSGLKFYRRIDAIKLAGSFLFSLTATPLGFPLKRILSQPNPRENFFSFGLVRRGFDNQEVIHLLAARLFSDIAGLLLGESQEEDYSSMLDEIGQPLQKLLNSKVDVLNEERVNYHLTEIGNPFQQLVSGFGRTPRKVFPYLLSAFQIIRNFHLQNVSKWLRSRQNLNKLIVVTEEQLKHFKPQIVKQPYRLVWPLVLWILFILISSFGLYVFDVPVRPIHWGMIAVGWSLVLYPIWRYSKRSKEVAGNLDDDPGYRKKKEDLNTYGKKYEATLEIFSEFERMLQQVELSQFRVLQTIEELKVRSAALKTHEEGSWFVHNVLWTGELDRLYRTTISDPDEKLKEFFSERFRSSSFTQDENYDLVADLFDFCQQRFKTLEDLKFEDVLSLCNTDAEPPPIDTFLNALCRSSSFLWRLGPHRIGARHIILGYGDFWSSDFANAAQQVIGPVEAIPIPSSRDVTMIQVAQGIQLGKFYHPLA